MSIQEIYLNIKHILKSQDMGIIVAILLVGISSFSLGRLSGTGFGREIESNGGSGIHEIIQALPVTGEVSKASVSDVVLAEDSQPSPGVTPSNATEGSYVASKSGAKYHLPWCGSAQQIKEENKIWFKTKAEAEAAGYTLAANCKGI